MKQKIQDEIDFFSAKINDIEKEAFNFSKLQVYSEYFDLKNTNIKVLEIGGGIGKFSFWLASKYPQIEIISTDINETLVKRAESINKYKNLKFQQANCEELPFEDHSFDIVFGVGILHHLPDITKTVREIKRVLKQKNKTT